MSLRQSRALVGLLAAVSVVLFGVALLSLDSTPDPAAVTAADRAAPARARPPATSAPTKRPVVAAPVRGLAVRVDAIGASSSLVPLGVNPDRSVEVPPVETPEQAGYYRYGPLPGDVGPAVILGHVNGNGRAGVFSRLAEMRAGEKVAVQRGPRALSFTVTKVESVPKTAFPTDRVYGNTPGPELRLITCGGRLDAAAGRYLDQVIVYATLDR